jgi:DNA-binding IscR family transcriptional regulator
MLDAVAITNDRYAGMTCAAVAEKHGCSESQVHRLMVQLGLAGQIRGKQKPREPKPEMTTHDLILHALDDATEVIIERGAAGGYIVTIDDQTGAEERDIGSAIRSALRRTE